MSNLWCWKHHFAAPSCRGCIILLKILIYYCRLICSCSFSIPICILLHQVLLNILQINSKDSVIRDSCPALSYQEFPLCTFQNIIFSNLKRYQSNWLASTFNQCMDCICFPVVGLALMSIAQVQGFH